jgi:hypothetical protein
MNEIYLWVGLLVVNCVLGALYFLTWLLGKEVWGRITRIYSFTVIIYWLDRLEKEGHHTFERARKEAAKGASL